MASKENFYNMANFYEQMKVVMSAILANKGGLDIDNYAGRFFAADVVEFLTAYGEKVGDDPQTKELVEKYKAELEAARHLTTPSKKPVYEMTLEEFEKFMNI
jgi:hypothetical protein